MRSIRRSSKRVSLATSFLTRPNRSTPNHLFGCRQATKTQCLVRDNRFSNDACQRTVTSNNILTISQCIDYQGGVLYPVTSCFLVYVRRGTSGITDFAIASRPGPVWSGTLLVVSPLGSLTRHHAIILKGFCSEYVSRSQLSRYWCVRSTGPGPRHGRALLTH